MIERIKTSADYIRGKVDFQPEVGIILGTGLGGLVNHIDIKHTQIETLDIVFSQKCLLTICYLKGCAPIIDTVAHRAFSRACPYG